MQLYTVKATTCGNPGAGQDPTKVVYGSTDLVSLNVPADKIKDIFRKWVDHNDLGSSDMGDARVFAEKKGEPSPQVADISYNGRLWTPDLSFQDRQELIVEGDQLVPNLSPVTLTSCNK